MRAWDEEEIVIAGGAKIMAPMPLVVSASRLTDIPAFYANWFMERLKMGYVQKFDPWNGQLSYIGLRRTRLIVFWSKNPAPMLPFLDELDELGLNYYFQFTLNDYEAERMEPYVPSLEQRIKTFETLSKRIGRDRVIWRFDPLVLTDEISVDDLLCRVEQLGARVAKFTSRLVFSFVDIDITFQKVADNLAHSRVRAREFSQDEMRKMAQGIGRLAKIWGVKVGTCGEIADFGDFGIDHGRCIDDRLVKKCFFHDKQLMRHVAASDKRGNSLSGTGGRGCGCSEKERGRRSACGCSMSMDIGEYNTCPHLCRYCYANTDEVAVHANWQQHLLRPHEASIVGKDMLAC